MTDIFFADQLNSWARINGLSYTLSYWESEDVYEVKIHSAAPSEQYYRKRVHNWDSFVEGYYEAIKS